MSKGTYLKRKQMGLCTKCGKEIEPERKGKTTCYSCVKANTDYKRETREFVLEFRICPRCFKNKLYGDERNCLECRTKNYVNREKQRRDNPEREEIYYQHGRRNYKELYNQRKEQGLCSKCGRVLREDEKKFAWCSICRGYRRSRQILSVKPSKKDGIKQGELA